MRGEPGLGVFAYCTLAMNVDSLVGVSETDGWDREFL